MLLTALLTGVLFKLPKVIVLLAVTTKLYLSEAKQL